MKKRLIILTLIFSSFTFTMFAETLEVETMTEALNYSGNRDVITKLIIKGEISGNDYSEGSEWSKFRTLDETFPNIEEVEILTSQDIPNCHWITSEFGLSLFQKTLNKLDDNDRFIGYPSLWLKHFSAPNVKYIGDGALHNCKNLLSINFPNVERIGIGAFGWCEGLIEINFPLVKSIDNTAFGSCDFATAYFPMLERVDWGVFIGCLNLTSVHFGTSFTMPTTINFGHAVFGDILYFTSGNYAEPIITENIELTLGEYVLPKPNTNFNTWQGTNNSMNNTDYIWKSIKIETGGIEEIIKNILVNIFPNPTSDNFTTSFEIKKSCNIKIVLSDVLGQELLQVYEGFASEGLFAKTFNTKHLAKGVYFLKILIDGKYTIEKIVVN